MIAPDLNDLFQDVETFQVYLELFYLFMVFF